MIAAFATTLALLVAGGGPAGAQNPVAAASGAQTVSTPTPLDRDPTRITSPTYRIAVEDTLEISVVGQNGFGPAGLSRDVIVLSDGTADLPYLGETKVVGMTLNDIRVKMKPSVEKEIRLPSISIAVKGRYLRQANVLGVFQNKGKIALRDGWRLRDLLAAAGGVPTNRYEFYRASLYQSRDAKMVPVDLEKLMNGGDESQNVLIEDGDTLLVEQVDEAQMQILVIGQVVKAGPVIFPRTRSIVDVLQAAGGPTPQAALSQVTIERGGQNIIVDMRDYDKTGFDPREKLQVGDRLVIPENKKEIYLYGAVGRSGTRPYPEDEKPTVYKLISDAGGQVQGAELKHTRLTRKKPDGTTVSQEVNVEKMLKTGDLSGDVAVEPGDSIYVPGSYRRKGFSWGEVLAAVGAIGGMIALLRSFRSF